MKLDELHDRLYARYGERHWWPADTPYEMIVGAVLTQNTNWGNVEKALANFNGEITPERVQGLPDDELRELIKPAGFFNQKTVYLKAVTAWFAGYDFDPRRVFNEGLAAARPRLLAVRGVGKETADSILLYACGLPTFVVDAYTKRLLTRMGLDITDGYDGIRHRFMAALPPERFNNAHALIVEHAKQHCSAASKCSGCPLEDNCPSAAGRT